MVVALSAPLLPAVRNARLTDANDEAGKAVKAGESHKAAETAEPDPGTV